MKKEFDGGLELRIFDDGDVRRREERARWKPSPRSPHLA
jgi:hypothetical protein